jgi:hypothetical protein
MRYVYDFRILKQIVHFFVFDLSSTTFRKQFRACALGKKIYMWGGELIDDNEPQKEPTRFNDYWYFDTGTQTLTFVRIIAV